MNPSAMGSEEVIQRNESLYELYRPQNSVPSMHVVFFHGFQRGDYEDAHLSTWLSGDGSCIWPRTWLIEEFKDACILSVSYNGGRDMYTLVENLITDLEDIQEPRCPIILVGHSFGGLVIKELCLRVFNQLGQSTGKLQYFLDNLKGLFFYATPHHGISLENPSLFIPPSPLQDYVKILSDKTERMNSDFDKLCKQHSIWRISGLGESLPSTWDGFHGLVVPEASSRGPHFNIAERADHISISRPPNKTSRRFTALTNLLKEIAMDSNNKRPENFQTFRHKIIGIQEVVEKVKGELKKITKLGFDGMGGIGKTTLAMKLFNDLERYYDYTCFIRDVKAIIGDDQKIKDAVLENMHYQGKKITENRGRLQSEMKGKKLLLLLDDVDSERDLAIVRILEAEFRIHEASRFVATSRDRDLLTSFSFKVHTVSLLSQESSKYLFLRCAPSGRNPPFQSYVDDIVGKCGKLPLTLEVVGKYLNTKSKQSDWKEIVMALDKARNVAGIKKLWTKLRISYDGLAEEEKGMFLDATTVFYKSDLNVAKAAWRSIDKDELQELFWQRLVDLSLVWEVRVGDRTEIGMHDQLLSLGRMIALKENGRRIWNNSSKAFKLLSGDVDVDDIKLQDIVALKSCARELDSQNTGKAGGLTSKRENHGTVQGSTLREMKKLQYLWLEGLAIDPTPNFWFFGPRRSGKVLLPSTIVHLHLSDMNFSDFPFDPSCHKRITILSLKNVGGFRTLPATFGDLKFLQMLTIEDNSRLERLDDSLGSLAMLKRLTIERCPSLKKLPETLGNLVELETLVIGYCDSLLGLPELPESKCLPELKHITITGCHRLKSLPRAFLRLKELERIELHGTSLEGWYLPNPEELKSLRTLRLSWSPTAPFPSSLPIWLREQVSEENYRFPLTFNVAEGIFHPANFQLSSSRMNLKTMPKK